MNVNAKTAGDIYYDKWLGYIRQPATNVRNVIENAKLVRQMEEDRTASRQRLLPALATRPVEIEKKRSRLGQFFADMRAGFSG